MPTNKSPNADRNRQSTPTRRNPQASNEPQKRIATKGADDDVRIADEEGDPRRTGRPRRTTRSS
jgi:hypothetical protein